MKTIILSSIFLVLTLIALNDCRESVTVVHNDASYYFPADTDEVTWFDAVEKCNKIDMGLIEIRTASDHFTLLKVLRDSKLHLPANTWMGGSDDWGEGKWIWISDFQEIEHSNWKKNQPDNNLGIENCISIIDFGYSSFKWNDIPCNVTIPYICYQRLAIKVPTF